METYIIIYSFFFILYWVYGDILSRHKKKYWILSLIPILSFTFIEGSRYLRGIDYQHYSLYYSYPELLRVKEDIGFEWLNEILRYIGIDEYLSFTVYALITIISLCTFIKPFKDIYKVVFVVMLTMIIHPSEWMIRQFISISIMYAAFALFIEKKYKYFIPIAFISISIHYSSLFLLIAFVIAFYIKKPISSKYSIPIIVLIVTFGSADFFANYISEILNSFNLPFLAESSYITYIDRSNDFLNSKAAGTVTGIRSVYTNIFHLLYYIVVFGESFTIMQKIRLEKIIPIFNLFVLGSMGYEFFLKYELFVRVFQPMELLGFIPASYIIKYRRYCFWNFSYLYVIAFILLTAIKFIFFPEGNFYHFIWDK